MKRLINAGIVLITVVWGCQQNVPPSTLPEMQRVEGGTFEMGKFDLKSRNAAQYDNYPPHSVSLSDFWVSKYEITVGQYRSFCNEAHCPFPDQVPDWGWHDNHPRVYVSWEDANDYCAWLSQKTGKKIPPDHRSGMGIHGQRWEQSQTG